MQVSFKKWKHLHFVQVGVMNAVLVSDGNIFFLWGHERWHLSPRHDFDPDRANKKAGSSYTRHMRAANCVSGYSGQIADTLSLKVQC